MFGAIYLDACSWVTAITGRGSFAEDLRLWLEAADRGGLRLVVSTLMPLEVLGGNRDQRTQDSASAALRALDRSSVRQVAPGRAVVAAARTLRLTHGLKSMDALHLASAHIGQAEGFLTQDERVLSLEVWEGVRIVEPAWLGDRPFDVTLDE